jgi:NarL family two-component system sensor histidine kinase YdfH
MKAIMKKLLRQSNVPEVEAELAETRPFFILLIVVLIFLFGISISASAALREPAQFLPYTALFAIHIVLHWYMPRLVTDRRWLAAYFVVQILLIMLLVFISQQPVIAMGLYSALAGETIGIFGDLRRSIVAIVGFLTLMGLTYGLYWGWDDVPSWLSSALIALLFVLIYVLLYLRQLNARTELQAAHIQLAEYAQQVEMLTLEAERQRMARELHDTLAQGLAGLVMQLEALEASLERDNTEKAVQIAGQAKERARTTLADARRAIDDLRATDQTLLEAINLEISRFTTATGIPCQAELPSEIHLKEQYGEHLVRCVSEGLANITRHAQATKVWVTITEGNDRLQTRIRDNGQGFNTDETIPNGHYGLLGLRERVRLAQGELTIESSIGEGTTLTMILPTNRDATSHPSPTIHLGVSS